MEANDVSLLTEALTADVQAVLADETAVVATDAAARLVFGQKGWMAEPTRRRRAEEKKNVRQCYARRRAGNDTLDICVVFITVIAQSSAMRAMPTDTVPVSKVPPLPTQPPARSDVAKHTRCGSPCRSYAVDGQYTALAVSKIRTGCENQTFA